MTALSKAPPRSSISMLAENHHEIRVATRLDWDAARWVSTRMASVQVRVRARRRALEQARWHLLLAWACAVLAPWILQGRSFVKLALPHSIPANLVISSPELAARTQDIDAHCPVRGLNIAHAWWNVWPTQYSVVDDDQGDIGYICHFVVQQYNIHGAYRIGASVSSNATSSASKVFPTGDLPPNVCQETSETPPSISYYFYHGSFGYYAFFEQGNGVFCSSDSTAHVVALSLGSTDLNGNALAHDNCEGTSSDSGQWRWSTWFTTIGTFWALYRGVVVHRSLQLCMSYGARCERLNEHLPLRSAFVFVHESAALAAHGASNLQRACLLYMLFEGLMCDLFLLIAKDGAGAHAQYVSLGYNLASILSLLFAMLEATRWIGERRCLVRRLFFNVETGLIGEVLCAGLMHVYLTSLNRSPGFRSSIKPAEVASFYVWSLVGHGAIVLGLASFILSVRAAGALITVTIRFHTLAVLTAPNCVDVALRGRAKSAMLRGMVWHEHGLRLFYTKEALKAYGVLQIRHPTEDVAIRHAAVNRSSRVSCHRSDGEITGPAFEKLMIVHHNIPWFSRRGVQLIAVGHIIGNHVVSCSPVPCSGTAVFCDHMLGGVSDDNDGHDLAGTVVGIATVGETPAVALVEEQLVSSDDEHSSLLQGEELSIVNC
jgi:hypothetical protein